MFARKTKALISALCMLLLILDTKTAIAGAAEGIELCIRVLIPSLFPFFIVSIQLTNLFAGFSFPLLRPVIRLLQIPKGSESLFFIGMLGGYPVGAQAISQAAKNGTLDKDDAMRMMGFCNNAGPAFLFGVISSQFPNLIYTWLIWAILILSTLFTAIILPGGSQKEIKLLKTKSISFAESMETSIKALSGVCGWVIIVRVILAFLERWFLWILPTTPHIALQMLFELANGSVILNSIENIGLRFMICTAGLSLGGFCVLMQTISVTGASGIGKYIPGKLIQTGFCALVSFSMVYFINNGLSPLYMVAVLLCCLTIIVILSHYREKHQNKYGIPLTVSV